MYKVFKYRTWKRLYEVPGYIYEIYLAAVVECQIEEFIFDLAEFCDENDCSPKKIFENDVAATFKIIGILNAFAAVYYEKTVVRSSLLESKDIHFELWNEVGKNLGRLVRFSTAFTYYDLWSYSEDKYKEKDEISN
jgi:hypothetical protein